MDTITAGRYVSKKNGKTYDIPAFAQVFANADGVARVRGYLVKDGAVTGFSTNLVVADLTATS